MAGRGSAGGNSAPPFDLGAGGFDFSSLQNVLNDPSIKAMAEKLAQDPNFAQMSRSFESQLPGASGEAPTVDPTTAHKAMADMFQNPDFVHMAQELGQKIMQSDPGMQQMMGMMQQPNFQENMQERVQALHNDPEISRLMQDIESQGPEAMMRAWSDPAVMERMSKAMGGVLSPDAQEGDGEEEEGEEEAEPPLPPLLEAAADGKTDELKQLLKDGADVDQTDHKGRSSLQFACGFGHLDCAEALIGAKASVDSQDSDGNTALHYAGGYDQPDAIAFLLKHNADKNIKNAEDATAAGVAEMNGHTEVINLLK
ncbi:hypothetical protein WJX73_001659 [Symbiochloris irregularis]|uniref:STI1/HOP DP domain-containing protein n=1 Tax=Symbiochloris irregularis TaxID=706552 RepID=A0AAW1P192_9CHLO